MPAERREAVGSGAADGASIFVESAKLKEQVRAMAIGVAEKSGQLEALRQEHEDTTRTMAAQAAADLDAKETERKRLQDECAHLSLKSQSAMCVLR